MFGRFPSSLFLSLFFFCFVSLSWALRLKSHGESDNSWQIIPCLFPFCWLAPQDLNFQTLTKQKLGAQVFDTKLSKNSKTEFAKFKLAIQMYLWKMFHFPHNHFSQVHNRGSSPQTADSDCLFPPCHLTPCCFDVNEKRNIETTLLSETRKVVRKGG